MLKRYLNLVVVLLCARSVSLAEIDWTPHLNTAYAEGSSVNSVYFSDGPNKYAIILDGETTVEPASGGGAKLTFKRPTSALFKIKAPITKVELPVNPDHAGEYRKLAQAYAPTDVKEFSDFQEIANVYQINHWKSYRVLFTYGHFGQRIRHSITFLTLESGQQVILDVSSYEKDFEEALYRSEHMIRTWYELELATQKNPASN